MLRKLIKPFVEFGPVAGPLYILDRILSSVSPRLRLYVYELMVQPIPTELVLPRRLNEHLEIRELKAGEPELALMPVRAEVLRARLAQNSTCLGAFRAGALIGYMWFCDGRYDEDEVRCTYLLDPVRESVFDFDFYLFPEHRMGLGFIGLWNGAIEHLNRRGKRYTFSRLTRFNAASRRAHRRLGGKIIARALFLQMWRVEVMLATVFPYLHVSATKAGRVRLNLRPGTANA